MINYSLLPSTGAVLLNEEITLPPGVRFTFHEKMDERQFYNDLRERLTALGASLEINKEELASIKQATNSFRMAIDEKEDILIRCNYFQRVYEVKESLQSEVVDTKELAERLRTKIAPVQVCPLKDEIIAELDVLIDTLPAEQKIEVQLSQEEELTQKAIEQIGDAFVNLGKMGQEFVITEVLNQFGDKVTIEAVRERTIAIEESLKSLAVVKEPGELVQQLDQLPYSLFPTLSAERKIRVATKLLEINNWNNLASVNRMISLIDKLFTSEERKQEKETNTTHTLDTEAANTPYILDGKAAITIDIKSIEAGRVQIS